MEPQESAKNDESSGFSKRRISSILKVTRKSAKFPDPEQQECTVEVAKPVEKRRSRRVSFAPANDVLLFSKDVKNASPTRNPLQELITATATTTKNRVQINAAEDGIQSIKGMEILLNAPLRDLQQKDGVNLDIREDYGEKTMMFSTDDAFMDMTNCHTINIANESVLPADISLKDVLPSSRERTAISTSDSRSMDNTQSCTLSMTRGSEFLPSGSNVDLSVENQILSSSLPCMDPEFENFLASLSKSSFPLVHPATTKMTPAGTCSELRNRSLAQIKTQMDDVDKENQVPASAPFALNKSSISSTICESSYRSALCPEDDVSMDITEAQTGRIQGSDDDDFFRCLFPTQEMYSKSDKRLSQTLEGKSKQQQISNMLHSPEPKVTPSLKIPILQAHQKIKVDYEENDKCLEKTMCAATDEFMDMTQSHTSNIASGPLAPQQMAAGGLDSEFKQFLSSLSKSSGPSANSAITRMTPATEALSVTLQDCESLKRVEMTSGQKKGMETSLKPSLNTEKVHRPQVRFDAEDGFGEKTVRFAANDAAMDVTCSHTANILTAIAPQPHQNVDLTSLGGGEKTMRFSANDACMDVTRSHTVNIASNLKLVSHQQPDALSACGEKTIRFSANDAAMDVTQTHTDNIATAFEPHSPPNVNVLPTGGEKTVRFTANDACMDVTRSHTVNIASNLKLVSHQQPDALSACGEKTIRFSANEAAMDVTQTHTDNIATAFEPHSPPNVNVLPTGGEKTVRFSASDAAIDVTKSHTVNIATAFEPHSPPNVNVLPTGGEKTVRFTANDACMDVTRSHTVNIDSNLQLLSHQNANYLPTGGEKTVRFSASDAAIDVTKSHTVNIATAFEPHSHHNVNVLPTGGEKTVRFSASDAAIDVRKSHTDNIATAFDPHSHHNVNVLPTGGEKNVRFDARDAAIDVTKSHTVNIATAFEPHSHHNVNVLPTGGEKTVRFTASDAAIDVTKSHTVNIASSLSLDSVLQHQDSNIMTTNENMDLSLILKKTEGGLHKSRFSSANSLDPAFNISLPKPSGPLVNPVTIEAAANVAPLLQEGVDPYGCLERHERQSSGGNTERDASGFVSETMKKPKNKSATDLLENKAIISMSKVKKQMCTDDLPQFPNSKQDYLDSNDLEKADATLQPSSEGPVLPGGLKILHHPEYLVSDQIKVTDETSCVSPSAVAKDSDTSHPQKSRRKSLAHLQSKIRRLSHLINKSPEAAVTDSYSVPSPHSDKSSIDTIRSLPIAEPDLEMGLVNAEDKTPALCLKGGEQASTTTTPFNLKTQQLMSRLSVGGFKAKLPQRGKPEDPKKGNSVGDHTKTIIGNLTSQLNNFDGDFSDIFDEELGSCEDLSETLDTRSLEKICGEMSPSLEAPSYQFNMDEPLDEYGFEKEYICAVRGEKRPLPEDENNIEGEKRLKISTEMTRDPADMELQEKELQSRDVECDGNITAAPTTTTQATDFSNGSHTASIRCDATFESTFKHSLFESQLEDYASDVQKKFDDGTVSVSEFFKVFNIDFVIHNPRQSILPGRLLSDTDRTLMDVLKDKHINRPKQVVYETDVLNLTEKVEGLRVRMQDLDKPLKFVNRPLWEDMRSLSEEELKTFGAKLKERNNYFRKTSKTHSHEMKEVLYSNLVQANLMEQQSLRGTIEKADEMIKSLDDCIHELETELTAIEQGIDGKPSLKSRQEDLKKVTEALAENERRASELEIQKKQNSDHLRRLIAKTGNLENHITMLHMLNEWKLGKNNNTSTVYTFLYDTLNLQVDYDKLNGTAAGNGPEKKISNITFKFLLDEEESAYNARLVHRLLSQYIEEESAWLEKYPTDGHIPKLLHDVSLVVSCCRLLGEELRLLKMWGSLKLDILDISSMDTQVHIVFSSLKKFAKFEVVFSISLSSNLYVLQLQSFKNKIGSTAIQQIEEIVASFSPSTKLLTKVVKKIHEDLLC